MLSEMIMDLEASEQIRAGKDERHAQRRTQRNSYRESLWEKQVGEIPLRIPKLLPNGRFPLPLVRETVLIGGHYDAWA